MIAQGGPLQSLSDWIDKVLWDKLPKMPLGGWVESFVDWAKVALRDFFRGVSDAVEGFVDGLTAAFTLLPSIVMILLFAALGWYLRGWKFALTTVIGMGIVAWAGYWGDAMNTLSTVLVAAVIALVVAVPVGVLAAESQWVGRIVRPVLDFMQTMPAMVYLIPAVAFFSVGLVPGVMATIVFSMPPGVRLTELGLRQVDPEVIEAGESFGASPAKILARIKLPLALPTIMAGVNQVIMLALSMVVIAGMVGGEGLGKVVIGAINSVDVAVGFNAGLAVVIIAIYLDRLTDALSSRSKVARAQRAMSET